MKDTYQIFDEHFVAIKQFVEEYKFSNCAKIASELIRVSSFADFKDGIMICETLETVFTQLHPLFESYNVNDLEMKSIRAELLKQIELLSKSYKINDLNKIYQILRDVRVMTTQFQFRCWNMLEEKSTPPYKRVVRGE